MPFPHRRTTTIAVFAALISALLTGCSAAASRQFETPAITATHSAASTPESTSTCSGTTMQADLGQGPDVDPAGVGASITLTNTATTTCTIQGFVTLSYLTSRTGPAIGSPARHDDSDTFSDAPVTLKPNGSAVVVFSNVEKHDPSCQAQPLWGYRILLPGDDHPITVNLFGTDTTDSTGAVTICPDSYLVLAPIQDPTHL